MIEHHPVVTYGIYFIWLWNHHFQTTLCSLSLSLQWLYLSSSHLCYSDHFVWTCMLMLTCVNVSFFFPSLGSSRPRLCSTTVCTAVRPPVSWRCSVTQAPEQNTLRAPSSEPPRPSHTSPTTTAQHANTGEAQTADAPGQGTGASEVIRIG